MGATDCPIIICVYNVMNLPATARSTTAHSSCFERTLDATRLQHYHETKNPFHGKTHPPNATCATCAPHSTVGYRKRNERRTRFVVVFFVRTSVVPPSARNRVASSRLTRCIYGRVSDELTTRERSSCVLIVTVETLASMTFENASAFYRYLHISSPSPHARRHVVSCRRN